MARVSEIEDILHPVSMALVQWPDLPVDILSIIFQKLKDPCDVYRCGLACVSWKSIVNTILPPFLLLSNVGTFKNKMGYFHFETYLNIQSCRLFNTQTNETHEIFLPEVEKCWFSSSSFRWLLTISFGPPHEMHLLNHFTRDRIQLPSAEQCSKPCELRVITSTTPLNPTCLVLAIRHFKGALAFCRPGDKSWTCFVDFVRWDNDVAFYKGESYSVNTFGHLFHLHCNIPVAQKVLPLLSIEFLQHEHHNYLVELDGNLLLVVRYTKELMDLSSISLPLGPFRNFKANCIYFISDNLTFFSKKDLMPVDNTGFYDMMTGQIEYLYDQASLILLSSLNWDILHSVSMAQVQWSDLPVEILPIIFQKLKDPCDIYRCGLVSVLWKSIATTILPPFLLLSNIGTFHFEAPLNKQSCSLFNTQTNETHEIFLPEVEKCWFSSSSFGWLLTICFEPPHEVHLLNPFTRDRIQLPLSREFRRPYDLRVITSTTPLNPTCLVLVIRCFQGAVAFCRPGDKYWTFFEDFGRCENDVVFYKGELYAVNAFGHLVHLHCNIPVAQKVLPVCSIEFLQRGHHCYLVELDGNLLLVVRYTKELLTSGFEVYELDWVEKVWIKVKNIGNNAIFLGTGSSLSLPVDHFRNVKANCIYFISDNLTSFFLKMDLMPMDNTGFYNMMTGQIEYLYDQASLIWLSSLNWFVPPSSVIYKQKSADVICREENSAEVICRDDKGTVKSWFSKIRRMEDKDAAAAEDEDEDEDAAAEEDAAFEWWWWLGFGCWCWWKMMMMTGVWWWLTGGDDNDECGG
ncbi:hypothetical protein EZV62_008814 [Acer yangbiense]|uniref:F-box domain-containing protein n=1 Tax=Acer yangbiense TaxID=1000413 RepID=A0A5C7IEX7_9ROSI|nr:hypothetical protein EZV62_008814 [Acer yangbiense]